jgi:large subunit ribosomal protein L21
MFAVLKTGGKQYKVSENDIILVEKLTASAGDLVQFDEVLMISDDKIHVGDPILTGAAVNAEIVEQAKNKKVTSFVKRRRKHSSQRTRGHRQNVTVLRIKEILSAGAKNTGTKIAVGATVIGSNPKVVLKSATKAEPIKKRAVKAEPIKKPAAKAEPIKKPAAKAEPIKKPAAKVEPIKKPAAKAEPIKKQATKVEAEKKSVAPKKVAAKKTTKNKIS